MRPPEFTGGNQVELLEKLQQAYASMRPPEFTGGNVGEHVVVGPRRRCFNEAAGIHRRKRTTLPPYRLSITIASMRPPEFTGGNLLWANIGNGTTTRFNEAAGIHRRKPDAQQDDPTVARCMLQ